MKIFSFIMLIVFLLLIPAKGFSQNANVSIKKGYISLEQLFAEIEQQTNLKFLYRNEIVDGKKVNVFAENTPVSTVLNNALKANGLKYTLMENNLIVVSPEDGVKKTERYISGRITDADDGSPIPAATVFFTNTTIGIATDLDGNYRLQIPGEGSYRLTVSHVGYEPVVYDIEPGSASIRFDVAMQVYEFDDLDVSAGIRFRQKDISLFWNKILGKNPSRKTIQATNPETVYYYYNSETRILKVLCREPLEIINYETGYHIQYLLDYFLYDYKSNNTEWDYQCVFTELEPINSKQQKTWEKKREEVYQVSISKFIKSLYNNTLLNDGFVLTTFQVQSRYESIPRKSDVFSQSTFINPNDIVTHDPTGNGKLLHFPNEQIMLISYGRPVNNYDIPNVPYAILVGNGTQGIKWERENRDVFRNLLHGDSIRIFSDGTYTNRLYITPMDASKPTLNGLSMALPIDYSSTERNIPDGM